MVATGMNYLEWLKRDYEDSNFWIYIGFTFDYLEKGAVRVKLTVSENVLNRNKTLHGGTISSMTDVAISSTIRSIQSVHVTSVSLTTNFINPVEEGKTYLCNNFCSKF